MTTIIMKNEEFPIVIIGATGFIGEHFVNTILSETNSHIFVLVHKTSIKLKGFEDRITFFKGDVLDYPSVEKLIKPNSIVINLCYLGNGTRKENLTAISNLINACKFRKAKRLIQCSTAVICGRSSANIITEDTIDEPYSEYEKIKLDIENLLIRELRHDDQELAILRPTCVFGPNGKNLVMLINDIHSGNRVKNYLKSCLQHKRTMNLVSVHNVTSALLFLTNYKKIINCETFIISDDEYHGNNFRYIEKYIQQALHVKDYKFFRILLPSILLSFILKLARKSNTNPKRVFQSKKLKTYGWRKERELEEELLSFFSWHIQSNKLKDEKNKR
ncbi:NAD(P)-dependent oxidoreductase [bacterium]|nr:NAD(P)-dependent oxidoreductase [bacterium]